MAVCVMLAASAVMASLPIAPLGTAANDRTMVAAISASPLPPDRLAAALVMLVLLGLAFGDIALAISAYTGNRGAAIGVTVALLVAMYLVDALSSIVDGLGAIRPLSLFRYYMGGDPLRNGLSPGDAAVLAVVAALFLALAVIAFERRDLAA